MAISSTSRVLSSICRDGELRVWIIQRLYRMIHTLTQLHCTSAQQSGGGSGPAMVIADWLSVDRLRRKCQRVEETTEERAAQLQSYIPFQIRCSHQACTTVAVSSLRNCNTGADILYSKISNRTRSLASLRSLMLVAQQLFYHNYIWSVNLSLARCIYAYVNTLVIRFNPDSKRFKFWL